MNIGKLQVPQLDNQSKIPYAPSQYGESKVLERVQKSQDSLKSTKSCDEDTTVSPVWERHTQSIQAPPQKAQQDVHQAVAPTVRQHPEVSGQTKSTFKRRGSPYPTKSKDNLLGQAALDELDEDEYLEIQERENMREISKIKEILQVGKSTSRDRVKREAKDTSGSDEDDSPQPKKHSLKQRSRSIHLGKRKATNDRNHIEETQEITKIEHSTPSRRPEPRNTSPLRRDRELVQSSSSSIHMQRRVIKMVVGPNRKRVRIREEGDDQHSDSRNQSPPTRKQSPSPPSHKPLSGVRNIKLLSRSIRHASPLATPKQVVISKPAPRKPLPVRTRKPIADLPNVLPVFFDMQRMVNHIAARTSTSREQQTDKANLLYAERLYTRSFLNVKVECKMHHWGQAFTRPKPQNPQPPAYADWNSVESVQGDEEEQWVYDADSNENSQVVVVKPKPPKQVTWQPKISAEQMYILENFWVLANFENDKTVYRVQRTHKRRDIYMKPLRGGRGGAFDESRSYGFSTVDKVSLVIPKTLDFTREQLGSVSRKIATNWRRRNDNYKDQLVQIIAMYLHHLPCFICKKTIAFSNLQQYFTHIIKKHQHIDSGFRCLLCNKDFYNWLSFEKHFDLKHTFA